MADTISTLKIRIEQDANTGASGINSLTAALNRLREATKGNLTSFSRVADAISKIGASAANLGNVNSIAWLAQSLTKLRDIKLSSTIAKNLQGITTALNGLNVDENKLNAVASAMNAMAAAGKNAGKATKTLMAETRAATRETDNMSRASMRARTSIGTAGMAIAKLTALYFTLRRVTRAMFSALQENNNFIEALNLATITMGDATEAAQEYAETVERMMGINQTDWLTNLGEFNQMIKGFGLAEKAANTMSQQLTQLAYDIQSAFNVEDITVVMGRLQSGIAGQVKGMRSYGVELSKAAIEEFALANGINKSWSQMSMAEKVMLRYQKIMETTRNIQGDMARTIITPANALRVLNNQWAVAKRYLGQVVSLIVTGVIPVFQTLVGVIGAVAQTIAGLLGYEMPKINYAMDDIDWTAGDDMEDATEGVADNLSDAAKSVKKMKDYLMGFDELNVISPDNGSSGGSSGGLGGGGLESGTIDFSPYTYDFMEGLAADMSETVEGWKQKLQPFFDWLKENWDAVESVTKAIGLVIAGWMISKALSGVLSFLGMGGAAGMVSELVVGVALTLGGMSMTFDAIPKILNGEATTMTYIEAGLGTLMTAIGLKKIAGVIFKKASTGATWQFGFGMAAAIAGLTIGYNKVKKIATGEADVIDYIIAGLGLTGATVASAFALKAVGVSAGIAWTVGLAATLAVALIAIIDANQLTPWEETEEYKKVQDYLKPLRDKIELSKEIVINMEETVQGMDKIEADWQGIQDMVDRIFELGEIENPTSEELSEMIGLIETINGMNIDGLKISYDETNGVIETTKENIDGVIDALKRQAKIEGYHDLLVSYYQQRAELLATNTAMENDILEVADERQAAIDELYDTYGITYDPFTGSITTAGGNPYVMSSDDMFGTDTQEIANLINKINEYNGTISDARTRINDNVDAINELDGEVKTLTTDLGEEIVAETKEIGTSRQQAQATDKQRKAQKLFNDEVKKLSGSRGIFATADKAGAHLVDTLDDINKPWKATVSVDKSKDYAPTVASITSDLEGIEGDRKNDVYAAWGGGAGDIKSAGITDIRAGLKTVEGTRNNTVTAEWKDQKDPAAILDELDDMTGNRKNTIYASWYNAKTPGQIRDRLEELEGPRTNTVTVTAEGITDVENKIKPLTGRRALGISVAVTSTKNGLQILDDLNTSIKTYQDALKAGKDTTGPMKGLRSNYARLKDIALVADVRAGGGYVSQGQLFVAREAGPELVGQVGGRTAVANNDQIVAAVSKGVYEAMMATQSGGKDVSFNLYIDGKQVTAAVEKTQRKRGATVLQKGVVNYG